jgi:ribonucleoside-diphosphate reductase alpha chain
MGEPRAAALPWPDVARFVWETRYRRDAGERYPADTWDRVAAAVAMAEPPALRASWAARFRALLEDFRFLPAGRILAGAGVPGATLFNCFVMGPIEDSADGVRRALAESAETLRRGGGIGCDFSTLRPRAPGTAGREVAPDAPGPVARLADWDRMSAALESGGARRGAMMGTLRCDHPDVEAFVDAKRDPAALTHFNLSLLATDAFMAAVRDDRDWPLAFPPNAAPRRVLRARALWQRLCRAACDSAEPGLLFVDRIAALNNLGWRESIVATNPCGEQPLPAYGGCDLGSLNLAAFVADPFAPRARLDLAALAAAAATATRFLDDAIDASEFPLPQQAQRVRESRRIGLGCTGLADALAMLGLGYGAPEARAAAAAAVRAIRDAAYAASCALATERGPFPAFERERYLERPFVLALSPELRDAIARDGIRNSHLTAIAPAGSISLLAGNVSSGIEPILALSATRALRAPGGGLRRLPVEDFAYRSFRALHGAAAPLPAALAAGRPGAHAQLELLAAIAPFVDAGISKTVSLAAGATAEDVSEVYQRAWAVGLKGCTVYRDGARCSVFS